MRVHKQLQPFLRAARIPSSCHPRCTTSTAAEPAPSIAVPHCSASDHAAIVKSLPETTPQQGFPACPPALVQHTASSSSSPGRTN
ncbi:hypothetical protein CC78DRAFT_538047 [Lojkania enalia]|uniref:Uncharacterized protein n=1 Tax=Lojkania enalia TaxID=147567 RepID=A0A9P4JW94_9PLEO|nr:hypothetical protein CC78DRAFT_538047 [Didymosphaeria enalia]